MAAARREGGPVRTAFLVGFAGRGVLAVVLALVVVGLQVLAAVVPRVTMSVLVLLFGTFALLDGLGAAATSLRPRTRGDRWTGLEGALGVAAGAAVLTGLVPTGPPLLRLVGLWALGIGGLETLVAADLRRRAGRGALFVAGAASLLLGIVVLTVWPGPGLMAFMWMLGGYAGLVGIARITVAMRTSA